MEIISEYYYAEGCVNSYPGKENMRKTILDDGSYPYLTVGAELVGKPGIPALLDIDDTQIPRKLIPFEKVKKSGRQKTICAFLHA